MDVNVSENQVTFYVPNNISPFILWSAGDAISIEASINLPKITPNGPRPKTLADEPVRLPPDNDIPKSIVLTRRNISLLRSQQHNITLEPQDKSYTLKYSVNQSNPESFLHPDVLTVHSFTCRLDDLRKTILHNLYHAHLNQCRTLTIQRVLEAREDVISLLANYHQSFADANHDIVDIVFSCPECRLYGKRWEWMKRHVLEVHWTGIATRLEYYNGPDYDPLEWLIKWKVRKDKKSTYAWKRPEKHTEDA
ncbi:hypothetical protein HDV00_000711 [Rhizophlyctis rosea]|nr:hypothetical protein HDV00_000711 [Rhizophlyctis rosea]